MLVFCLCWHTAIKKRRNICAARQAAYYLLFWLIINPFSLYAANGAEIGLHQARLFENILDAASRGEVGTTEPLLAREVGIVCFMPDAERVLRHCTRQLGGKQMVESRGMFVISKQHRKRWRNLQDVGSADWQ